MFNRPDRRSAKDVEDLIQYLQGSCMTFNHEEWEEQELDQLNEELFDCEKCGWWEEVGYGDGSFCEDCLTDELEAEELEAEELEAEDAEEDV